MRSRLLLPLFLVSLWRGHYHSHFSCTLPMIVKIFSNLYWNTFDIIANLLVIAMPFQRPSEGLWNGRHMFWSSTMYNLRPWLGRNLKAWSKKSSRCLAKQDCEELPTHTHISLTWSLSTHPVSWTIQSFLYSLYFTTKRSWTAAMSPDKWIALGFRASGCAGHPPLGTCSISHQLLGPL